MSKTGSDFDPEAYSPVAERIRLFYRAHPLGRIETELVRRTRDEVVFKALVYRDTNDERPAATGWAAEREGDGEINLVACLENTETSAIGRALANLGFTASRQRPSAEEIAKASRVRTRLAMPREVRRVVAEPDPATRSVVRLESRAQGAADFYHPYGDDVTRAALVDELLANLRRAERLGARALRVARWRQQLVGGTHDAETLARCAARLRRWVVARRSP